MKKDKCKNCLPDGGKLLWCELSDFDCKFNTNNRIKVSNICYKCKEEIKFAPGIGDYCGCKTDSEAIEKKVKENRLEEAINTVYEELKNMPEKEFNNLLAKSKLRIEADPEFVEIIYNSIHKKKDFKNILDKVPDREPLQGDEL